MSEVLRFKDLAPETYSNQSRDFQMLTRLLDLMSNSQMHRAEQSFFLNNPEFCSSDYLRLLSHKLGFDYQSTVYENELRQILQAFKYLVSYKGSLKGISEAVNLFMNIKREYFDYTISVDHKQAIIYIDLYDRVISDLSVLTDILRYILPCGYALKYRPLVLAEFGGADAEYSQKIQLALLNSLNNTAIAIKSPEDGSTTLEYIPDQVAERIKSKILNAFNTMQVVANSHLEGFKDGDNYKAVGTDVDVNSTENEETFVYPE